jgi:hypothetical protein
MAGSWHCHCEIELFPSAQRRVAWYVSSKLDAGERRVQYVGLELARSRIKGLVSVLASNASEDGDIQ